MNLIFGRFTTRSWRHVLNFGILDGESLFEIVFDEQVIFGPRAKMWHPVIRESVKQREPEAYQIMPVDPIFRSDLEFLPIQACDLVAWINRRGSLDLEHVRFNGWKKRYRFK